MIYKLAHDIFLAHIGYAERFFLNVVVNNIL